MMLEPGDGDEEHNQTDDEPLFRLSENKEIQEALHHFA
jgi:hypothetical protein